MIGFFSPYIIHSDIREMSQYVVKSSFFPKDFVLCLMMKILITTSLSVIVISCVAFDHMLFPLQISNVLESFSYLKKTNSALGDLRYLQTWFPLGHSTSQVQTTLNRL